MVTESPNTPIVLLNYYAWKSRLAEQMAASDPDPARRAELEKIAAVCRHVPAHAPRDFWEAIQAYWFTHLGVVTELNTWWTGENSSSSVLTTK